MLQGYSVRLRIYLWFKKYCHPKLASAGVIVGDVGRRQQEGKNYSITPYLAGQQLNNYGFPKIDSQALAYQRIKSIQANHREAQDQRIPLEFNLMINQKFHLNSKVGENEGINYTNHREKYER